jgi:hypothetical protein
MIINLNVHKSPYKNALDNAIQIVSVIWGSGRKAVNHLLAYAIT